jgi:hypothetical protein
MRPYIYSGFKKALFGWILKASDENPNSFKQYSPKV